MAAAVKEETQQQLPSKGAGESQEPLATDEMCAFCFKVLIHHLSPRKDANGQTEGAPSPLFPNYYCPLFVSWKVWHEKEGKKSMV